MKHSPHINFDKFYKVHAKVRLRSSTPTHCISISTIFFGNSLAYSNSILLTGSDMSAIIEIKEHMHKIFDIKDLECQNYFIVIEFA